MDRLKEFVWCETICWGYAHKMQQFSQVLPLHPLAKLQKSECPRGWPLVSEPAAMTMEDVERALPAALCSAVMCTRPRELLLLLLDAGGRVISFTSNLAEQEGCCPVDR